jgi:hypothetical protein
VHEPDSIIAAAITPTNPEILLFLILFPPSVWPARFSRQRDYTLIPVSLLVYLLNQGRERASTKYLGEAKNVFGNSGIVGIRAARAGKKQELTRCRRQIQVQSQWEAIHCWRGNGGEAPSLRDAPVTPPYEGLLNLHNV